MDVMYTLIRIYDFLQSRISGFLSLRMVRTCILSTSGLIIVTIFPLLSRHCLCTFRLA